MSPADHPNHWNPPNASELTIEAAISRSFLADINRETVAPLLARARLRDVPAGTVFIDPARFARCGLIVSGLARVYLRVDGAQATLRRVAGGAAVGIRAIVGRPNRVTVQAITDVEFLEIDAELLVRTARREAELAMALAEEIHRRLEDTELQSGTLATGTVRQKVAGALLDHSVEGEPLVAELSHETLAEMIGASREWVGHELRALAREGLVRLGRARVTLLDPIRLQLLTRAHPEEAAAEPTSGSP
jgi:CRP-like cAMP-binding protein